LPSSFSCFIIPCPSHSPLFPYNDALPIFNDLYISHTHSDHIGDFTGLVWAMAMEGRTKPLRVVSSSSAGTALERILDLQSTPYRSEEHTSELQSRGHLVCRRPLEKNKPGS